MKAVLDGSVLAEADDGDLISIEGNWYFPPSSVTDGVLVESPTPYRCPWKGDAQYYSVRRGDEVLQDLAWSYPALYPGAIERVGRDFSGYIAFSNEVEVTR